MSTPLQEHRPTGILDEHRFPFAVGVVGHRDLVAHDTSALADSAVSLLRDVQRRVPHARVELLSGLAAGADLLVAETALQVGVGVRAVLPMPWEMYREDFGASDRARVERLLASSEVEASQLPTPAGLDLARAASPGPERDRFYVGLMNHLVQRSHLLLALWDGQTTGLAGGTGDVVLRFLSAFAEPRGPGEVEMIVDEAGDQASGDVVAWLPVRRDPDDPAPPPRVRYLTPGVGAGAPVVSADPPESYETRLAALDAHLAAAAARELRDGRVPTPTLLAPFEAIDASATAELAPIAAEFDRADRLAMFHQRRSNLVFKMMALAAGAMGLFFLLYAKVDALEVYLVAYLVLAVAGYVVFVIARREDWFTRHLTDRVVAESLRVRFYLTLAGIEDDVEADRLLDLTGITGLRGFAWVHDALRVGPAPACSTAVDDVTVTALRGAWIDDQATYFRARLEALLRRQEQFERVRATLFALAFAAGVALLFFSKSMGKVELTSTIDLKTAVLVLMGLFPLWLGIWELYQNKMATRELIWQYRNQAEHFTSASRALAATSSAKEQRRVITDLGHRALFEVYLWSLHRFHREYEPSLPG